MKTAAALLAATAAHGAASAMEATIIPGSYVVAYPANEQKGYYDLMVQTIVLHNDSAAPATLTALQIDLAGPNGALMSKSASVADIARETQQFAGMAADGVGVFLNAQILNEKGLEDQLGAGARLGGGGELAPNEAAISTAHYFAANFLPERVVVTVSWLEGGAAKTTQASLPVRLHKSPISYRAPLGGAWMISGFPNLRSHHRFLPSNEFALDFMSKGPGGALDEGKRRDPSDDYGFGAPVLAAADGVVALVIDGQRQDVAALSRRDDESIEEAGRRISQLQMQRFAQDFRAAAGGNMIVLRHEQDGVVEYSAYGHLKEGSITVKTGERVTQGAIIGALGNTGDSTLAHLHFQVNAGADPFFSRSLPVAFKNGAVRYVGQEPGYFMVFDDAR